MDKQNKIATKYKVIRYVDLDFNKDAQLLEDILGQIKDIGLTQPHLWDDLKNSLKKYMSDSQLTCNLSDGDSTTIVIAKKFAYLDRLYKLDQSWIEMFMNSVQMDARKMYFVTMPQTLDYLSGSAESSSLLLAKVLRSPFESYEPIKIISRSIMLFSFIADIKIEGEAGRCLFPKEDLEKFGLNELSNSSANANPVAFKNFINFEIDRFDDWQKQGMVSIGTVPKVLRRKLKLAIYTCRWKSIDIRKDPMSVFEDDTNMSFLRKFALRIRSI